MQDNDSIERLSKKLGSRSGDQSIKRSPLHESGIHAPHQWKEAGPVARVSRRRFSTIEILFAGSLTFFVVAVVISSLLFFSGNNTVSTKNVDVRVTGPSEIGAGNTLSLQVTITNRNAVPMELTDLLVEFPPGTRSDADVTVELPRIRESLGTIETGESITRTIRAVAFGESGKDFIAKASVEYRVPSSNAIFVGEAEYIAKINQAPASIVIDTLTEAVSGQDITLTATIVSNAPHVLSDMLLLAEYPPGFTFISSSPSPVAGTAAWTLGDIEEGGQRAVTIRGRFTGEDGDSRVIHFSTGNKKVDQDDEITAPLAISDITVAITKPFVSLVLFLDNSVSNEHIARRGEPVVGEIRWTNNLPIRVQDVEIELTMKGAIIDRGKITSSNGFYRSLDTKILWTKESDPNLADVEPGESGVAAFTFATLPPQSGTYRNPEIDLAATVRARRVSETNVPEIISTTASTHVVVATDLELFATLSRSGAIVNSGPLPPQADKETTYTTTWMVTNSVNAVANASVSALLPSYVKWTGVTVPMSENITFNSESNVITWQIGDMAAATSRTVSFKVALTPSLSQVGETPTVVGDQRIYAIDRFIRAPIERSVKSLTTQSAATSPFQGPVVP